MQFPASSNRPHIWFALLLLLIAAGIWLRLPSPADSVRTGFDESVYSRYVSVLSRAGLNAFPQLCEEYLQVQRDRDAFLPPTRILFLTSGVLWTKATGATPTEAVRGVSCVSACLVLLISTVWAWRLGGASAAIALTALIATASTQVHMAHRALIDGFFAMWALLALWMLWEALRAPDRKRWVWFYGIALAALVLTKENAAFVWVAICGILVANHWARFGEATRDVYVATIVGPFLGACLLVLCSGGPGVLLAVYRLNVEKSVVLPYAHLTGDGPWFRYFVDLLLVSPAVMLITVAALGEWNSKNGPKLFFGLFFLLTLTLMSSVRYGMNLRYGNMWDFPMRWLVYSQLSAWAALAGKRYSSLLLALGVCVVCSLELVSYNRLFVDQRIYDPTVVEMGRALDLIKLPTRPGDAVPDSAPTAK